MRATAVVEIEITGQCLPGSGHSFVAVQIDLFILHGFPKPFDENVVSQAPFTFHADLGRVLLKQADKGRAVELAPLIGVHDLQRAVLQHGFFQRLDARIGRQRVGQGRFLSWQRYKQEDRKWFYVGATLGG